MAAGAAILDVEIGKAVDDARGDRRIGRAEAHPYPLAPSASHGVDAPRHP